MTGTAANSPSEPGSAVKSAGGSWLGAEDLQRLDLLAHAEARSRSACNAGFVGGKADADRYGVRLRHINRSKAASGKRRSANHGSSRD
jgi:hypothetical protein